MMDITSIVLASENIVFLGGAGVSTDSGIPDFRSAKGIHNEKHKVSPEEILSASFFISNTEQFYDFYKSKMIYLNAKPNATHSALAKLEEMSKLKAVITQNIDGLHQKAGSKNVLELHGSIYRNYCTMCGKSYNVDYIISTKGIPKCECDGIIKPDVVLYQEQLDNSIFIKAINTIKQADVLIVGGTSLSVYPAAGLVEHYRGDKLILINKSATNYDSHADVLINENISEVFSRIL